MVNICSNMLYQAAAFPGIALFFAISISRTVPKTDILKLIYFWYMSAAFSFLNLRTIVVGFLETHRFYNPIRQNYNHIKSLSTFLHLPLEHFYSCIIFSDHCSLRSIPPYSSQYTILYQHEVVRWLQSCLQQQPILYSDEQLAALINTLQDAQNFAPYIQDEHRYQVWEQTHGTTCPFCGSPLVLRNGKYGRF